MIDDRNFFNAKDECLLCGDQVFYRYDKDREAKVSHLLLFHSLEERMKFKECLKSPSSSQLTEQLPI